MSDDRSSAPPTPAPIESFWDLAFRDGDHHEHWDPPQPPAELAMLVAGGLVAPGARVLDVGCGSGIEAVYLARLGFAVIGVDRSREGLARARATADAAGVEVDWRVGDALDLPLDSASVNLVLDRGCLHVIARRRRARYAAEAARVLRVGGVLVLRGAAVDDDEEEGLVALDAAELDRWFLPAGFTRGPVVPMALVARSGVLDGNLAVLRRM